ncbi:DNA polymerase III subunit beta family protein [Streptomyces litchfieldiae]|uniref:MerR family transcriptional regulator n=1 Tax=Streptomyces litchfieldiae TaxID=3075543 RepID=A0ABU2MJW5_9ACTN|nr:MerR family transcriptional regulator [Streptomyces sp. DSM 44938]MDT0341901.1 MerR family transcriptional regulator [Streptomyces sp. DSM 44938]
MRSIAELARDSGLSVTALRFYDRAGVLVPAWVDPGSGYRWYADGQLAEARLLARLRKVRMPLADVRLVLAGWSGTDATLVLRLLEAHLRRLEAGLADARKEFSAIRAILEGRENQMISARTVPIARLIVPAGELAAALDAVRFAVSSDPELPTLHGVLFDIMNDTIHVVATDRYRLAVAHAEATGNGPDEARVIVPTPLVDAMRALLTEGEATADLTVGDGLVALEAAGRRVSGSGLDHEFPDYRRLTRLPAGRRVVVDAADLTAAMATGPVRTDVREQDGVSCAVSVLALRADGTIAVTGDAEGNDDDSELTVVNRDFFTQALAAAGGGRLVLDFGGPAAPLTIRPSGAEDTFSMLMPVRLTA